MSDRYPMEITDEMRQAMDTARRQGLQKDLRALAAHIRAETEGRYAAADPGWEPGVEWTLLGIENTASQLTETGRSRRFLQASRPLACRGQGVSPE
ncbi:hypothetical protein [Streptomyces sp. NPDC094472]|uniref:hypothetical protein n=1 Tax=Streptomyces sp. NPDC094472 TaxID=3155080 RepID=UPI0033221FD1